MLWLKQRRYWIIIGRDFCYWWSATKQWDIRTARSKGIFTVSRYWFCQTPTGNHHGPPTMISIPSQITAEKCSSRLSDSFRFLQIVFSSLSSVFEIETATAAALNCRQLFMEFKKYIELFVKHWSFMAHSSASRPSFNWPLDLILECIFASNIIAKRPTAYLQIHLLIAIEKYKIKIYSLSE